MTDRFIETAFAHSGWATVRLIEACESLTAEQLETPVRGTYGSVLETLRHMVEDEAYYLLVLDDEALLDFDTSAMMLPELREVAETTTAGWAEYFERDPDLSTWRREVDEGDGFTRDATVGIRLLQQVHHSNEHRTQVCTALSVVGVTPPKLDAYTYGVEIELTREFTPGNPQG